MEKAEACFHEAKYLDQNGDLKTTRVPMAQELARQDLKDLPEQFKFITPEPTALLDTKDLSFPTIDLSKLRVGFEPADDRVEELAKLASVAKEWGMVVLTNHGVADSVLDSVKNVVEGFFNLSFEEKKASVGTYMSKDNMGYGRNLMRSEDQPLDWVDRLTMKAAPKNGTDGLNVWPQNPANFKEVMEKFVEQSREICDELLQALAEALSLDRQVFLKHFEPKEECELKLKVNYYPPCPRPDKAIGLPPHSDASALTLLIQYGASGGLQVKKDMKSWISVPWEPKTLLLNFGDLLEIMSNGMYKSSWHRVLTQTEAARTSIAVFYNPPPNAMIEPIQVDTLPNGEYKKVLAGDYVKHLYSARTSLDTTKHALTIAKVQSAA